MSTFTNIYYDEKCLSEGAAAIYVHGNETSPKILQCKITDSNNVGLFVSDGARGVYEDNEICGNRLAGVWVKAGASPIMRRNQVHHGKDAGFFIFDGGMVRKFTGLNIHTCETIKYLIIMKNYWFYVTLTPMHYFPDSGYTFFSKFSSFWVTVRWKCNKM